MPTPREWAPSPVWPEGRGLFLLRPLLAVRRAELRAWLSAEGERWIDDPANDDPRFARTLARRALAGDAVRPGVTVDDEPAGCRIADDVALGAGGEFSLPRDAFDGMDPIAASRRLSVLCLCAAGGQIPPRREALARLIARLAAAGDVTVALAGARIEARDDRLLICREAGEFRRTGLAKRRCPLARAYSAGAS